MVTISSAVEKLKAAAEFIPEFEGDDVFAVVREPYESLLDEYPQLKRYPDYLEFLRATGGAFINHPDYSLGIYGFEGYVVTSFAEDRLFLDRERYFHFGDVLYPAVSGMIYVLAFDFQSELDRVLVSENEAWEYSECSPSFARLLLDFAGGKRPGLTA